MQRNLSSCSPSGALTRCITHDEQQVVVSEKQSQTDRLVVGKLMNYKFKEGVAIHGGKTTELTDFQVISTAPKSVVLTFLLHGKLEFGYDQLKFSLDAQQKATGVVVNLAQPCSFRRKIIKDNQVTKLNIILSSDWVTERIADNANISQFLALHQANMQLLINERMVSLIEQIIDYESSRSALEKLKLETLSHMLVLEVFQQLEGCESFAALPATAEKRYAAKTAGQQLNYQLEELVTYIETHLDSELSTKVLAEQLMMSESSLQRKFKSLLGYSIQNYIKRRKLEVAKQLLQSGIVSVTEVAYNAGYRHPSNFTSAFKKAFGYPPTDLANVSNQ